jgi:hypothetical protein
MDRKTLQHWAARRDRVVTVNVGAALPIAARVGPSLRSDSNLPRAGRGEVAATLDVVLGPLQRVQSMPYADFSNSSRPISMRRISLVPAPIS